MEWSGWNFALASKHDWFFLIYKCHNSIKRRLCWLIRKHCNKLHRVHSKCAIRGIRNWKLAWKKSLHFLSTLCNMVLCHLKTWKGLHTHKISHQNNVRSVRTFPCKMSAINILTIILINESDAKSFPTKVFECDNNFRNWFPGPMFLLCQLQNVTMT